jgi:hypothetical protein
MRQRVKLVKIMCIQTWEHTVSLLELCVYAHDCHANTALSIASHLTAQDIPKQKTNICGKCK